ncbi:hypothetical protein [Clostridium sp. LP20]|uniref:hypothetical protein n=1 Tax=Clostridium sp. LP20 TaxID=3418665 RepID=UPI003EE523C3
MPGLLSTRVCNARFSSGKKYYEDLQLNSHGDALVIDMVNGGGKSFLIQCIGQTIIPNSRWQNDWDFKAVFEPKNKNTVIHCVTEWELDDGMEYKYLLAGFCASKPTKNNNDDDEKTYADFERFSYICLYNNRNENDIFNLPLKEVNDDGSSKFMSLSELKKYLNIIKSADYYTEVFTVSKSYRKRLSQYNITEAEWELIKGVNADEKYVATYLRQYPNAEKFILDFLIPKIEECYSTRLGYEYQDSEKLASSLLNIREKMDELMKSKSKSQEYEKIIELIQKLAIKLQDLSNKYTEREKIYTEIKKSIIYLEEEMINITDKKSTAEMDFNNVNKDIETLDINIQALEIRKIEKDYEEKLIEEDEKKEGMASLENTLGKEEHNYVFKSHENTYHSILQEESNISRCKSSIEILELNNNELVSERNSLGVEVKSYLLAKKELVEVEMNENLANIVDCNNEIDKYSDSAIDKKSKMISLISDNERISKEKDKLADKITSKEFKIIQNLDKDIFTKRRLEDEIEENIVIVDEFRKDLLSLEKQIKETETNINSLNLEKVKLDMECSIESEKLEAAANLYGKCEFLFEIYDCSSVEDLNSNLSDKLAKSEESRITLTDDISKCKSIISTLKNHKITLSKDTMNIYSILKGRFSNVLLGLDFISSLDIKEKEYFIKMNSLIPYAVLLEDNDYKKFIEDKDLLDNYYGSAVPVISKKTLQEVIIYPKGVTFTSKDIDFYTNEVKIARLKLEKEEELKSLEVKVKEVENIILSLNNDIKPVREFIDRYINKSTLENLALTVRKIEELLDENEDNIEVFNKLQISLKSDLISINERIKSANDNISEKEKELRSLELYLDCKGRIDKLELELTENNKVCSKIDKSLKAELNYIKELKARKSEFEDLKESFTIQVHDLQRYIDDIAFVGEITSSTRITEDEFLDKKSRLTAVLDKLQGSSSDLKNLNEEILRCEERIGRYKSIILRENFTIEEFAHITIDFVKNSEELLEKLSDYVKSLDKQLSDLNSELMNIKSSKDRLEGRLTSKIEFLLERNSVNYSDIRENMDEMLQGLSYVNKLKDMKNIRKEAISIKAKLEKELKLLDDKIRYSNDTKNKFILLDKDIDIELNGEKLTSIRNYQDVSTELKIVENSVKYKVSEFKREVALGKNMTTSIQGYSEILSELEELPTISSSLKDMVSKLAGEDDNSWISMLKFEQEKIVENIKSLELQEEKFITLCIQKSENVLRDIKKLTELSVIELNGRRQEMLRINLNKLPDELAREKMKNYIEGIIGSCSEETDDAVRKIKISKGLTTDNLFKQIIDRIKNKSVELYKLEDADNMEVNDWLSLDRAYGSKGETNGMYITMLICIITYLRKLYTNSTDESKKVVILDNPFSGTTSEIIWLPILNLLKENNVQLWAAGFEIKTQLANIFPTRYYMGKKASRHYEKIIINRFHSDYNLRSLGYEELYGRKMDSKQIDMDID